MFKRIIILAVAFFAIAPAAHAAPTLDTKRAERAVVRESFHRLYGSHDVTCERTSARHARCVQRYTLAPDCVDHVRWAAQLSHDGRTISVIPRDTSTYVGNGCPTVEIEAVDGDASVR